MTVSAGSAYRPVDARILPRFAGVRTFARLPHVDDNQSEIDVAVLGFPFDTATSYRSGARFGPEAIRSASALLRPYHLQHGVDVFERLTCVDAGDVPIVPGDTAATYVHAQEALARVAAAGVFPLVLGGDHSITLAELRVLADRHGPLALIQFDAHGDTWDEYFGQKYFHGTTFRRALEEGVIDAGRSVQAGLRGPLYGSCDIEDARRLGFTVLLAEELRALGPVEYARVVRERVGERPAFLSFDVDFCDPAHAPGTGTPEIGGFSSAEAQSFVRALTGIQLVGADVVEVAPAYDGPGQATALLGANIAWEVLALVALDRELAVGAPSAAQPEETEETSHE